MATLYRAWSVTGLYDSSTEMLLFPVGQDDIMELGEGKDIIN